VLPDAFLQLLGGEVRVLQRHRREGDEALRVRRAGLGELLVLDLDDLSRDVAVRRVPIRIDAERLDVDALLVHRAEPLRGLRRNVQERRQQ